jgi:hypothetical protein
MAIGRAPNTPHVNVPPQLRAKRIARWAWPFSRRYRPPVRAAWHSSTWCCEVACVHLEPLGKQRATALAGRASAPVKTPARLEGSRGCYLAVTGAEALPLLPGLRTLLASAQGSHELAHGNGKVIASCPPLSRQAQHQRRQRRRLATPRGQQQQLSARRRAPAGVRAAARPSQRLLPGPAGRVAAPAAEPFRLWQRALQQRLCTRDTQPEPPANDRVGLRATCEAQTTVPDARSSS